MCFSFTRHTGEVLAGARHSCGPLTLESDSLEGCRARACLSEAIARGHRRAAHCQNNMEGSRFKKPKARRGGSGATGWALAGLSKLGVWDGGEVCVLREGCGVKLKEKKSIPRHSTKGWGLAEEDPEPQTGGDRHVRQIPSPCYLFLQARLEGRQGPSMDLWADVMQLLSLLWCRY